VVLIKRDPLLPGGLSKVHHKWRTPYVVTAITGVGVAFAAALLPVGQLAVIAHAGTLYAFFMVALAVMLLRKRDPGRKRSFRVPALWLVGPLTMIGCLGLYLLLPVAAILVLPIWGAIGLLIYYGYSYRASHLGRGIVEVHEPEIHDIEPPIPGVDETR
jgi:APA family basic amino acid/polyamine antiporter